MLLDGGRERAYVRGPLRTLGGQPEVAQAGARDVLGLAILQLLGRDVAEVILGEPTYLVTRELRGGTAAAAVGRTPLCDIRDTSPYSPVVEVPGCGMQRRGSGMMSAMKLEESQDYDADPDTVFAMLCDQTWREEVCRATHAVDYSVEVE